MFINVNPTAVELLSDQDSLNILKLNEMLVEMETSIMLHAKSALIYDARRGGHRNKLIFLCQLKSVS